MMSSKLTSTGHWLNRLGRSRHALGLLFLLSVMETLFLPVPLEFVLIPWMLCHPDRKWAIAGVALSGNLTAAIAGYYLGFFLMEQWGYTLIDFFADQSSFDELKQRLQENGFMSILAIGISPVPFQIAILAAGATGYSVFLFGLAAILSRGIRYFGLAFLVSLAGAASVHVWKRYALPIGITIMGCIAIWLWLRLS
jgi:membrane protein YqaA with SNARE-associated domain